jgi:hypothetical protein
MHADAGVARQDATGVGRRAPPLGVDGVVGQPRWPALEKKAAAEGRTVVWVDQLGFYLLPLAVRTWAPCGQTPVLRVPLTHDHLAATNGITPDGRLFMRTQNHAYRSPDVVRFLRCCCARSAASSW